MTRYRAEAGQTTLLVVGLFLVVLLLVVVVVDASAAYLRRQELDALADSAALAAADSLALEGVYRDGVGDQVELDPGVAREAVAAHLALLRAARRYPGLTYDVATSADRVDVRVRTPLPVPLAPPGWAGRSTVSGSAGVQVQVRD